MLQDINFLKIAHEVWKWSKCVSKKVGAIIVKDTRILSSGYTWTPAGHVNCDEYFKEWLRRSIMIGLLNMKYIEKWML